MLDIEFTEAYSHFNFYWLWWRYTINWFKCTIRL